MTFKSDEYNQRRGFQIYHSTVCGGRLQATEDDNVIFSHANYESSTYPRNAACWWTIGTWSGATIMLEFVEFELESSKNCSYDYVLVYDEAIEYGRFCGGEVSNNSQFA